MKRIRVSRVAYAAWGMVALGLVACAHKIVVEIPPRIDLSGYGTIGIVQFSSPSAKATEQLDRLATERFMAAIQQAQPGVRFLELGSQRDMLTSIRRDAWDPDAVKAVGKAHGVQTVFTGRYDISNAKPKVSLGEDLSSVKAAAIVSVSLTAKHWDTGTGATLWTATRSRNWSIADVDKEAGRPVSFSVSVPEDRYGQFVSKVINAATDDFRPHYEKRKVPKP